MIVEISSRTASGQILPGADEPFGKNSYRKHTVRLAVMASGNI